jgi:hypothetical protein
VNREQAAKRLAALKAMTVDRGCTPAEARMAAAKAKGLAERFGPPRANPPRRPPAPSVTNSVNYWWFDLNTGRASDGVKVKSYRDKANWKIEIDL